jgi:hypothetical protein
VSRTSGIVTHISDNQRYEASWKFENGLIYIQMEGYKKSPAVPFAGRPNQAMALHLLKELANEIKVGTARKL